MIRLLVIYGSRKRDLDILVVADEIDEALSFLSDMVIDHERLDLTVLRTDEFLRKLKEDPFYVNVVINGEKLIDNINLNINELREIATSKAKEKFKEICKEGHGESMNAYYYYLIARGMFPKDDYEVMKILGLPHSKDAYNICSQPEKS